MVTATTDKAFGGTRTFGIVWGGQVISFIGSGLTSFALGVWVYQTTGSITEFALISLFTVLPAVAFGPVAGALTDRWDRRWAMILSDAGAGISTLVVALLLLAGRLEIGEIYVVVFARAIFSALRWPALSAATTQLVPKKQFGRANGMLQLVDVGSVLISPLVAGVLMGIIGLAGVILIDFATFLFAILTLLLVRIPRPATTAEGLAGKGSLFQEMVHGWNYITARTGLLALLISFSVVTFMLDMITVLVTPLVLSFASPAVLGTVLSLSGIGYLSGGIVMSVWGGTRRRIDTVIGFTLLLGVFAALIGLRPSIPLVTFSIFMALFCSPILSAAYQAIWQSKVAPDVQGRVFGIRRTILSAASPLAYLAAGPLADRVFEPLLAVNGSLAGSIGQTIGVGQGRGVGLLIITMGLLVVVVAVASYLYPRIRRVEDELVDVVAERTGAVESGGAVANVAAR